LAQCDLVGVKVVQRPWQACCAVKPEACRRDEIPQCYLFKVVTVRIRRVQCAHEEMTDNLSLRQEIRFCKMALGDQKSGIMPKKHRTIKKRSTAISK
jgi:hypothetical protein